MGCVDVDWKFGMLPEDNALCVAPGTVVNFIWEDGHNVDEVPTQADFDACTGFTDVDPKMGPFAYTASGQPGIYYLVCGVKVHCEKGNQKLALTVSETC